MNSNEAKHAEQIRGSDITALTFREIPESIPHILWLAAPDSGGKQE